MAAHPVTGLGAMIDRASSFGQAHGAALRADAAGFYPTWVAPKIMDGLAVDEVNVAELIGSGWLRAMLGQGHVVAPWVSMREAHSGGEQARAYLGLLITIEKACGLPARTLCACVEDEVQGQPSTAWNFAAQFSMRSPLRSRFVVPLGLGFRGGDGKWYPADVNLRAWRTFRFRSVVECYQGSNSYDNCANVLAAHKSVFDAPKPLFPAVDYDPQLWLDDYLGAPVPRKGFAAYPGERLSPDEWRDLGARGRARQLL
jgi:hypothetical protein